jgi:hypothetical protein
MRDLNMLLRWGLTVAFGVVTLAAQAQMPLEKHGSCPSGYYQSGNYCTPSSGNAAPALPKVGSCPSGYYQSGDYCLGSSSNAKPAMIKNGSCPSGFYQSGDYCLKS